MPWERRTVMDLRTQAVVEVRSGQATVTDVARRYGVSRACLHKWLRRFAAEGLAGLRDRSRRPQSSPGQTAAGVEDDICRVRDSHETWGADKVHRVLLEQGLAGLPSSRTVHRILHRHGRTEVPPAPQVEYTAFERGQPNELWQIDFKKTVYLRFAPSLLKAVPFAILDDHSRFNLALRLHVDRPLNTIWPVLWEVMGEWGLPQAILTDNDGVFRGRKGGVSAWTARLYRLGIQHLSGRAYHPQTQGKIERLHGTVQRDILDREVFASVQQLQERLDEFRHSYNYERPHAALQLDVPARHYQPSPRKRPDTLPAVEYPAGAAVRRVHQNGAISVRNCRINVGDGLRGEHVCLHETDEVLSIEYAGFIIRQVAWDNLRSGGWL